MAFDNFYPNRKDRRKPYRGAKSFDRSCRNNGSCSYCRSNRLHATRMAERAADYQLELVHKGKAQIWTPS